MTGRTSLTTPVLTGSVDNVLLPHTAQVTENTEDNWYFFSAVMFHNDKLAKNEVTVLILRKV